MFHNGICLAYKGIYNLPYGNTWMRPQPRAVWMSRAEMEALNTKIRKLPSELRVKIFKECLLRSPLRPNHPFALLAALRPDKILYEEALEAFYYTTLVDVKPHKLQQFPGLQDNRILQFRKLSVYFHTETIPSLQILSQKVQVKISLAVNLEFLQVHVQNDDAQAIAAVMVAVGNFKRLKNLILLINSSPDYNGELIGANPIALRHRIISANVKMVEGALGGQLKETLMEGCNRKFVWKRA